MIAFFLNCLYLSEETKKPYYVETIKRSISLAKNQKKIPLIAQEICIKNLPNEQKDRTIAYPIPEKLERKYVERFPSEREAWIELLSSEQKEYTEFLRDTLEKMRFDLHQYPNVILTFSHCISLSKVCKEKKIPVYELEYSPIRFTNYACTLGFMTEENKFSYRETAKRYESFCKEKKYESAITFTRKELMALVFLEKNIHLLEEYNKQPEYEVGVALGPRDDCYREVWGGCEIEELLEKCREIYNDSILIRAHPRDRESVEEFGFDIDHSDNSLEFVLRCKKIVTISSNVAFEGMWLGRPSYVIGDLPFSFQALRDIRFDDDMVCDAEFINFMFFCCFTPFHLMHDANYIQWRLTKPSELQIYQYHLEEILKELNIPFSVVEEQTGRLNRILEARGFRRFEYAKTKKEVSRYEKEAPKVEYDIPENQKNTLEYCWYQEQLAKRDKELSNLETQLAKFMIKK